MLNTCTIRTDEVCLYVTIDVRANHWGKYSLIVVNVLAIAPLIWAAIRIDEQTISKLPVLIGVYSVVLYMLVKYTLWNFFGKEILILNTKSLSYQYNYGFFITNLVTKPFIRASVSLNNVRHEHGIKTAQIVFFEYNQDDLPKFLHTTSLSVKEEDAVVLLQAIEALTARNFINKNDFPGFSLN